MRRRRLIAKIADQIYFLIFLVIFSVIIAIISSIIFLSVDPNIVPTNEIMNSNEIIGRIIELAKNPKILFLMYFVGGIIQLISLFVYFSVGYLLDGSPGKYLLKLRVVDNNGNRPKFFIFLIREPMIIRAIIVFISAMIGCTINLFISNTFGNAMINFLLSLSSPLTIYMLCLFALKYDLWCKYTKTSVIKY